MQSDYSTNGGYYYYFIFRSMHSKLITMVVSRKKMGIWGKEWKGDLHFADLPFFVTFKLSTLYIYYLFKIIIGLKNITCIFVHFNLYYVSGLSVAF